MVTDFSKSKFCNVEVIYSWHHQKRCCLQCSYYRFFVDVIVWWILLNNICLLLACWPLVNPVLLMWITNKVTVSVLVDKALLMNFFFNDIWVDNVKWKCDFCLVLLLLYHCALILKDLTTWISHTKMLMCLHAQIAEGGRTYSLLQAHSYKKFQNIISK